MFAPVMMEREKGLIVVVVRCGGLAVLLPRPSPDTSACQQHNLSNYSVDAGNWEGEEEPVGGRRK